MDTRTAEKVARELMDLHGLTDWKFRWDNSKQRAGVCKYGPKIIGLSKPLVELWAEGPVRDTILHEIAHALVGPGAGHGFIWRQKCLEIGGDGRARYHTTEETPAVQGAYSATCKAGHVHYKHRMPTARSPRSCGLCSRRFDPENLLIFSKTTPIQVPVTKAVVTLAASLPTDTDTHVCAACGEAKPSDAYGMSMGKRRPKCKACINAAHKAWRESKGM